MSERERPGGGSDRERRAELEALQVELRRAKESLALGPSMASPRLDELRATTAQAAERRAHAVERARALEDERARLHREIDRLERELEEQKVLARGARLRDQNVDWADARNRDGTRTSSAAAWGSLIGTILAPFLIIGALVLLQLCGRR